MLLLLLKNSCNRGVKVCQACSLVYMQTGEAQYLVPSQILRPRISV